MLKVIMNCIKKMFSKRALWIYLLIICVMMTAYIIYTIKLSFLSNNTKPELFGSNQNIIKNLKENEKGDSYKFLVIGDSRENYPIAKQLINPVAKEINFAMLLGDACGSTRESHNYLHITLQELNLKVPFFYAPGNKDFAINNDSNQNIFTESDFIKEYGALNFSFTYHNDLFIVICSVGRNKYTQESLKFLKTFQKIRSHYRHCFIFMHMPPNLPVNDSSKFIADNKYIPLFEKLKANYVFASHYHGYQETYFNGVNYIITGGGGASLDKKTIRQFYHSIEFTISPQSISRRIIYSNGNIAFSDWLEEITIKTIIPFFHNNKLLMYTILCTLSILWILLVITAYLYIYSPKITQDN